MPDADSMLAQRPAHVPEAAVRDFDMYLDPGLNSDPQARLAQMAADYPDLFWTPRNMGQWVLVSHAAVFDALRDWETFSSAVPEAQTSALAGAMPPGISRNPMPTPILFTDSAASKVADLIAEEGNPDLKLRVFVQGGGCSGFQYGFTFDEVVNEDDTTMTKNGVSLLIDAMSYQYLLGAEIDYKEDLQGAQFVIKNPNATTTCGCGSSFSA